MAVASFLAAVSCSGNPFMGLAAPEDGGERDAVARDGRVQDTTGTGPKSDVLRDPATEAGVDREDRDSLVRDMGAIDPDGPGDTRDASADGMRGSEGGHDAPPRGADSDVVADGTGARDAAVTNGADIIDVTEPTDASHPEAGVDRSVDIVLDLALSDAAAIDLLDPGVDVADDFVDTSADLDGFVCGFAPPGVGGECPAVCNDGCIDGTCKIGCREDQECKGATLECPAGFACEVSCVGKQSCNSVSVICPQSHACNLLCTGQQSCKALEFNCRSGVCNLECLGNDQPCDGATMNCGAQTCTASCSGSAKRPALNCGQSCDCRPCP